MSDQTSEASPRFQARVAGFLYLIIIAAGAAHLVAGRDGV